MYVSNKLFIGVDKMITENCNGVEIVYPQDCGNAPRKEMLINLYKAITNKDEEFVLENTTNEITLEVIGKKRIKGKDELIIFIKELLDMKIVKIKIANVLTHGRSGAVNGTIIFEEKPSLAFCNIYNFSSTGKSGKVKEVTSYAIKMD